MKKSVLIIAYQFCPKGQIGTRRWSKFAKFLTREGYTVHVISAKYPYRDEINWCHDVENNPNIVIHRISARYPTYLLRPQRNFTIKLFDRLMSHSFYYMDMSMYWGKVMLRKAREIIRQEEVRSVFATGAPFMVLEQVVKLKQSFPSISLMIDIRDPWSPRIKPNSWINKLRKRKAFQTEKVFLAAADKVIFVTQHLKKQYADLHPAFKEKYLVVYNGYDDDDNQTRDIPLLKGKLNMIFTGALFKERVEALLIIVKAVASMNDPYINEHFRVNLYGYHFQPPAIEDPELQQWFDHFVTYRGVLTQKAVFQEIAKHSICLSILTAGRELAIGVKTIEYMGLGKKIYSMARRGELKEILTRENQYVSDYTAASIIAAFRRMKHDSMEHAESAESPKYQKFNMVNVTRELISLLPSQN